MMSLSPVTAQLTLIDGDSSGFPSTIDLNNQNCVIGRSQDADIVWRSLQISRKHATLEYMQSKWYIRDMSANGMSVNEMRLAKGELFPLKDEDIISLRRGIVKYRFKCIQTLSPPAPSVASNGKRKSSDSEREHSDGKKMLLTETEIDNCNDLEKLKGHLKDAMLELKTTKVKLRTEKIQRENEAFKEKVQKKIMEVMESEMSCSVCNEVFIQATVIDCGHTFCDFCIRKWSKSKKKPECPLCRKAFGSRSRNIQMDNYITKIFESFTSEISAKRKISIKERTEQERKAAEEARKRAERPQSLRLQSGRSAEGDRIDQLLHRLAQVWAAVRQRQTFGEAIERLVAVVEGEHNAVIL